ncbi:branched-chain amino acid aminotransferase [Lutibacter oricola]|uniref:branched-chain-amino-acid transaminase n=1 Tax=Lutibacter oricola TaxID=762486 RepID=A0A1H2VS66_9FLAO|nr:aminotransferase class IV [Lutibacter oricola]SDW70794.1 branched-chain amino acid aminotransferase [Lutibacter oricola]
MINFNGALIEKESNIFNAANRAFKYGDAVFETIKVKELKVIYLESHYFRLMASLRMLRMEIPLNFTMEYFEKEIISTVEINNLKNARVRFSVYRENGGLYTPETNAIGFLIEASGLNETIKEQYTLELYKDFYINSGLLSTLKTTNKLTNVLASIYCNENNYDNCILLNERKQVVEAINGNIFLVKGSHIITPPITDGCIKGVMRKKLIEYLESQDEFTFEESSISPFDIQKSDEVFITNAIVGVQPVTNYRKKVFSTVVGTQLKELSNTLV